MALEDHGLETYFPPFEFLLFDTLEEIRTVSVKEIKRLLKLSKMNDVDAIIFLSSETFRQQPGDKELKSSRATEQLMFPPWSSLPDTSAPKVVKTLGDH